MKKQLEFVEMLANCLFKETAVYIKNKEKNEGKWYDGNFMDRNHGKYALKRKIVMLRNELLNLEKMLK